MEHVTRAHVPVALVRQHLGMAVEDARTQRPVFIRTLFTWFAQYRDMLLHDRHS